jgi:hypothetical protein
VSSEVEIPDVPEAALQVLRWRAAAERMTVEEYLRRMVVEEAAKPTRISAAKD